MINECDRAEIRHQCREMYKDIGFEGCLDCLNECFVFAEEMSRVLLEEKFNKNA